jgi:hypothetical protein
VKIIVSNLVEITKGNNGKYWGIGDSTLNTFFSISPSHASWQIRASTSFY